MGLFSFLNGKKKNGNSLSDNTEIPENVFIENEGAAGKNDEQKEKGIYLLYQFLEQNYETKGYDDALMNPDNTNLQENIAAIKNDLERTIRKVKTHYEDLIRKTDFHIASRSRSGMIDIVEELQVEKQTAESHIQQIKEIEVDAAKNLGVGQGLILSYTRGFKNGLAAISHHSIMKKNF